MKILLYSRPMVGFEAEELSRLIEALQTNCLEFMVNTEFASVINQSTGITIPDNIQYQDYDPSMGGDLAVSYGGDGTFLDCVRLFGLHSVPLLGINSGRLGFLANVPKTLIKEAFADIKHGKFALQKRSLLEATGDFADSPEFPYAFNEFSIQRSGSAMIAVETYVNGEMVATYWGDGVILSTPSGSTAYSLSVGGPVVDPECGCMVLSPIAPHNLTMRPVVLPDTSEVMFRVSARDNRVNITLDSENFISQDGAQFRVAKSKKYIFLARLQNISFYDTLRNKMLWGIDRRDETV